MKNQFTFLGQTVTDLSIKYGWFLVVWAVAVSFISASNSFTSYIPAFIGLPIMVCGYLSRSYPGKSKIWMHIAILFGLIAFLGGLDFLRGLLSDEGAFANLAAGLSKLLLLVSGGIYLFVCIKSFMWARKK